MSDLDYGGGSAPPAPQQPIPGEGLHDAVCFAVVDWGEIVDEFNGIPKGVVRGVRFFFDLDEKMADGKPYSISTYTKSIKYGENSGFAKLMKGWLGKECPPKLVGFPLGSMRGRMASLNIEHRAKADGTFSAKIASIMKPRPGAVLMQPISTTLPDWVKTQREKDNAAARAFLAGQGYNKPVAQPSGSDESGEDEDGISRVPFDLKGAKSINLKDL